MGFVFNGLGLDTVISILFIEGISTKVFNISTFVTDLINQIVQVLKEDLYWFRISTQQVGLLKPTESGNEG